MYVYKLCVYLNDHRLVHLLSPKTIFFHGITRWFDSSTFVLPLTLANVTPVQSPSQDQFPWSPVHVSLVSLPSSIPVNHLPCCPIAGSECVFFFSVATQPDPSRPSSLR